MFLFFIIGSVLEKPNIPILMESLSLDQKESLNRYCFCIAREFHHVAKVREAYPNIQNEFVASARKQPEDKTNNLAYLVKKHHNIRKGDRLLYQWALKFIQKKILRGCVRRESLLRRF